MNVMVPVGLQPAASVKSSFGIRFCAVLPVGCFFVTTRCSLVQTLVAGSLFASPM